MIWLYRICLLLLIGALAPVPSSPGAKPPLTLEAVRALPDPEKRAEEATRLAEETVKEVVKTFHDGEVDQGKQMLDDHEPVTVKPGAAMLGVHRQGPWTAVRS